MMAEDLFVTFNHLHSLPGWGAGHVCHRGARMLAARYGLDWAQIVRDGGIAASRLIATGDALALALVEHARKG